MDNKESNTTQHWLYLDALKVLAIFFVIFNHTGNQGFFLFPNYSPSTFTFWVCLFASVFCKFAVPVFFAVSGALLLNKFSEPLSIIFKKRILWKFVTLMLISLLYYFLYFKQPFANWQKIIEFLGMVWSNKIRLVFWFIYAYIGYLATLPILRILAKNMEKNLYFYIFALAIFFTGVVPIAQYLLFVDKYKFANYSMNWLVGCSIFVFPFLGYFFHKIYKSKSKKRDLILLWSLNLLGILTSMLMTSYKGHVTGILNEASSQQFHSCFALVNCACIFLTTKYTFEKFKCNQILENVISSVGGCSFGIYLFHIIILRSDLMVQFTKWLTALKVPPLLSAYLLCFVVLLISYVITLILSKVTFKKILS